MSIHRGAYRVLFLACLLAGGPVLAADIDGDGVLDGNDVCCNTPAGAVVDPAGRPVGDLDGDCDVDLQDYALLALNLTGPLAPVGCPTCSDMLQNGGETDLDCGGGACPPCMDGLMCLLASDCQSGLCQGGFCATPSCTDLAQNGSETDLDCGGVCPPCLPGQGCLVGSDCTSFICTALICSFPSCSDGVQNGAETGVDCGGSCTPCQGPNGTPCGSNAECLSGQCVDAVCCESACNFVCERCDLPGNLGSCSNIANGSDPDNECAGATTCNGTGACTTLLNNGSVCSMASQCLSGQCVDGVCCNSACAGACQRCNQAGSVGSCTNIFNGQDPDNECAGATTCNGTGACTTLLNNGSVCSSSSQCLSGNCVDGVCCNSACTGVCQRCNQAGSLGSCTNVLNGQDPDNECTGSQTCNGAGGCQP